MTQVFFFFSHLNGGLSFKVYFSPILAGFSFDATKNVLKINRFGLRFFNDRIYTFMIATRYMGTTYNQEIRVVIQNANALPLISLR
jgi:hypothetical protein